MNYFKKYLRISPFSHALWRACEARSLQNIKLKRPILDLGCGFGEFAGVFYESSIEVGVDNSHLDIEKASNIGKYKKLMLADARYMPFKDGSFRTVISISVIEHIPKTPEVLREVYRVLSKGGQFVFTTPRKNFTRLLFYPRLLRLLRLESLAEIYEKGINKVFKHYSLYEEEEWEKLLSKAGFSIKKLESNIGEEIAVLWDLGLIFALPSQLFKMIFGKRLVLNWKLRVDLLNYFFYKFTKRIRGKACNLLIVAVKPN